MTDLLRKPFVRCAIIILLFLIGCFAMSILPEYANNDCIANGTPKLRQLWLLLKAETGSVSVSSVCVLLALSVLQYFILFREKYPFSRTAFILAACFACFLLIGKSFAAFHGFDFIAFRVLQLPIAFTVWCGYLSISYTILKLLIIVSDRMASKRKITDAQGALTPSHRYFKPGVYIACVLLLLLIWTLETLPFFPGNVPHDGRNQLHQYFGVMPYKNEHPVISTLIIGAIYSFGTLFGGNSAGTFTVVLLQMIVGSIVFSSVCSYIYYKTDHYLPAVPAFLFFAFTPAIWTYLDTVNKDTFYMIFFSLFILTLTRFAFHDDQKRDFILLGLSVLFICIFRKEGIAVCVPACVWLIIRERKNAIVFKRLTVAILSAVVVYVGLNTVILVTVPTDPPGKVEPFSIPIQQVAACVVDSKNNISEDEIIVINNVVKYGEINARYNPEICDPVKDIYNNPTDRDILRFLKLWIKLAPRNLPTYLKAATNMMFGYFDPSYEYTGMGKYQLYIKDSITFNDKDIVYSEYVFSQEVRSKASSFQSNIFGRIFWFLGRPGFYIWILIFAFGMILRKKAYGSIPVLIPLFSVLIVCILSPVNGLLRYELPIIAVTPLMFLIAFDQTPAIPERHE